MTATDTVDLPGLSPLHGLSAIETVDLPPSISPASQSGASAFDTVDMPAEQTPPVADIGSRVQQRAQQIARSGQMDNAASMSAKVATKPPRLRLTKPLWKLCLWHI